eukprot:TRINITY_DN10599_c0_g1_i2.p1 TRINITY_DN10599_c0_g1~~TRINITY_DN10599_c0_g1_i2.p1  ORF type:complete len:597 (+),score=104.81 TRINITY_DN10599_c0_g1_i2:59-1849(+)
MRKQLLAALLLAAHTAAEECFTAACLASKTFVEAEEEPPIDLRPVPAIEPKFEKLVMCRVWLKDVETPSWQPTGVAVVTFKTSQDIRDYFSKPENDRVGCIYAHWVPGGQILPEQRWMHNTIEALWGRVERDLIVQGMGDPEVCKGFVGAKGAHLIERERCKFGDQSNYGWCKCHSGRKVPKTLICVPESHKLAYDMSPLLDHKMTCVTRHAYRPVHVPQGAQPVITPRRPYPQPGSSVKTAVLAYVNSQRLLEGTAETFRTWVPYFLQPLKMSLFFFREKTRITQEEMVKAFRLSPTPSDPTRYSTTAVSGGYDAIYLAEATEVFPETLNHSVLAGIRPRCGCPPLCSFPTHRSPDAFMISGLRYVQGTSAFTQELLGDPRLADYDFLIKIDWDIRFFRTVPVDVMKEVVEAGAWGFHTGFANNGNGCSKDTQRAMDAYARLKGTRAKSAGDWLYENEQLTWHSALFGVWTGLVLSPEYADLMNYLRTSEYGYSWFRYRWTDQSIWPKIMGYFHHDLVKAMHDLRRLRWNPNAARPKSIFYHRKKSRTHQELCCGKCDDNVDRACYKHKKTSPYVFCTTPSGNMTQRIALEICER